MEQPSKGYTDIVVRSAKSVLVRSLGLFMRYYWCFVKFGILAEYAGVEQSKKRHETRLSKGTPS
jgi:hypothetical protein